MEPGLNFKTRGGFQVTPPASLALFSSRVEEGGREGSRFSRLPVNFFPVICLRLGGRRNGREEWGKKKKKDVWPRTYCHCGRTPTGNSVSYHPAYENSVLRKLNRYIPCVSWINTKLCLRFNPMPTPLLFILSSLISPVDRCLCIGGVFESSKRREGGRHISIHETGNVLSR